MRIEFIGNESTSDISYYITLKTKLVRVPGTKLGKQFIARCKHDNFFKKNVHYFFIVSE